MLKLTEPFPDIVLLYSHQEKEINDYGMLFFENHFDIVNSSTELLKMPGKH